MTNPPSDPAPATKPTDLLGRTVLFRTPGGAELRGRVYIAGEGYLSVEVTAEEKLAGMRFLIDMGAVLCFIGPST